MPEQIDSSITCSQTSRAHLETEPSRETPTVDANSISPYSTPTSRLVAEKGSNPGLEKAHSSSSPRTFQLCKDELDPTGGSLDVQKEPSRIREWLDADLKCRTRNIAEFPTGTFELDSLAPDMLNREQPGEGPSQYISNMVDTKPTINSTPALCPPSASGTMPLFDIRANAVSDLTDQFSSQASVKLRGSIHRHIVPKSSDIIATCISGTGRIAAIVLEEGFLIYESKNGEHNTGIPKYIGKFSRNGDWQFGVDGTTLRNQGPIVSERKKVRFCCAAVNDYVLAAGTLGSDILLLFSIGDGGCCVAKFKPSNVSDLLIHKILFNCPGSEMAVLCTRNATKEELWQFYSISETSLKSRARESCGANTPLPSVSPNYEIPVEMTFQNGEAQHIYKTREAKFSRNGRKVVACTNHAYGTALVTILSKDSDEVWTLWGSRQIHRPLHNWDEGCLGFTSVDLYCPLCKTSYNQFFILAALFFILSFVSTFLTCQRYFP